MVSSAAVEVEQSGSAPVKVRAFVESLVPKWSVPALLRGVRAAVVVPGLFALTSKVVGNPQMATFAAFGGFATLVLAGFGGRRRDRLIAHLGLAVTGSVLLVIGTAVSSMTVLAALVTVVVGFAVLFAGAASANAASGATAVLLAYVLPAASAGDAGMIPSRLAGWWLASAAGTLSVMILFNPPPVDRLRRSAAVSARALSDQLTAGLDGTLDGSLYSEVMAAKHAVLSAFTEVPYRPTGITVADQAIADLVQALQWCTNAVVDAVGDGSRCARAAGADRELLALSAQILAHSADLIDGGRPEPLETAVADLERVLSGDAVALVRGDPEKSDADRLHRAFHGRLVAAAARNVAFDLLIASRRMSPGQARQEVSGWWGLPAGPADRGRVHPLVRLILDFFGGQTSFRSIWFLNSLRGAVALALAVTVADVTNVQHGFWVVLGALSVLRTSAASTGATALRALAGTVVGFCIGALLLMAIGTDVTALWVVLPLAVLVAAYTPGSAPFAVGQAAFTVTITILYNIIVPVGWKVGELRVEDVALGVAISVVVGALFWPRGATRVVADDLADAFHVGGLYLVQASGWALGIRDRPPDAATTVLAAGTRLEDALRGLLAEQGTQRVDKETLWRLVGGAARLRLLARGLARTRAVHDHAVDDEARAMMGEAVRVAGLYDGLAARLGHTDHTVAEELASLHLRDGHVEPSDVTVRWVGHHLDHLRRDLEELDPATQIVARRLTSPWWT